jgi:GAF domain-containing protein
VRAGGLETVVAALDAATTPDQVADAIVLEGAAAVGGDAAVVCRVGVDRRLEVTASKGYPAAALAVLVSAPVDDLAVPLATAVQTRQAVLLEEDDRGGAVAALPLGSDGALAIRYDTARPFTADDRARLVALADVAAHALERAALRERLQVLEIAVDTAPVALGVFDEQLRLAVSNRHFDRLVRDAEADLVDIVRSVLDGEAPVVGAELRGVGTAEVTVTVSAYPVTSPRGARRVAVAATSAAGHDDAEHRLREESQIVETLYFVARQLAGELDPSRVLDVVTHAASMVTDADAGVYIAAPEGDVVEPVVVARAGDAAPFVAAFDADLARRTLVDGEVVRVDDTGGRSGATSYLAVPITARNGRSLGAIFLVKGSPCAFDERDERLVVGIAGQAGIALDDAELFQTERRVSEQLRVLAEAGRVLASSLDVDDILREVAGLVVPALADACMIDLTLEDGTVRRVATAAEDPDLERALESHPPRPEDAVNPALRRIRTSTSVELVHIDDAFVELSWPDDAAYQRLLLARVRSAAVVPMTTRDTVIGRLTLIMGGSGREFRSDDSAMLLDLGRRIALAVENARLFAHQRSVAIALQKSLLPDRLPHVPGVSMAARYLPGGPDVDVGGDWYDVLAMRNGTMGFAMGDVVGRGVAAAALMGQLRSALRGYALEGHRPGACLEHLDVLLDVITGGALVTAVKGHLYPNERRAVVANAGHLPPLLLRAEGGVEFVAESLGVPLSTLEVPRYEDVWIDFQPGTAIVLYTDGLVEERGTSLDVGLARLVDACRTGPRDDLEALCDHILGSLLADRTTRDDVALLVVRLDA